MNTFLSRRFALLAATALFTHTAFAGKPPPPPPPPPSSGTVVLDYAGPDGVGANSWGLAAAPSGIVFALGNYWPANGNGRQLILGSSDSGNNWSVLDDYAPPGRSVDYLLGLGGGIALDPSGNLYVSGLSYDFVQPAERYLRRSTDRGAIWTTVDNVVMPFVYGASDDVSIAVDAAGDVYVSGWGSDTSWSVRKGVGGTLFSTVDAVPNSFPTDIIVHPTAGIFVVGQTKITIKNTTSWAWLVRRSTDGGATWANVDVFQYSSSKSSGALGISANASGIYVVGRGSAVNKAVASSHWIVRKSTNDGNSWTTADDYQLAADNPSSARCVVADAYGNLVVAGRGNQGGNRHWVVRKSIGGTGPWTTVDVFQDFGDPNAIAADAFGNVFVGGSGGNGWLIKKY